eukprot:scaffold280_cov353-Prasinococcus_capsulatus_cf.AAC.4
MCPALECRLVPCVRCEPAGTLSRCSCRAARPGAERWPHCQPGRTVRRGGQATKHPKPSSRRAPAPTKASSQILTELSSPTTATRSPCCALHQTIWRTPREATAASVLLMRQLQQLCHRPSECCQMRNSPAGVAVAQKLRVSSYASAVKKPPSSSCVAVWLCRMPPAGDTHAATPRRGRIGLGWIGLDGWQARQVAGQPAASCRTCTRHDAPSIVRLPACLRRGRVDVDGASCACNHFPDRAAGRGSSSARRSMSGPASSSIIACLPSRAGCAHRHRPQGGGRCSFKRLRGSAVSARAALHRRSSRRARGRARSAPR